MRVCAVCGRTLDYYQDLDDDANSGWMHTLQDRKDEDHPAVPVNVGEVPMRGRCDFCNVDEPTWIFPARTFVVIGNHLSDGEWAACDGCKELIAAKRWDGLVRRCTGTSALRASMPKEQVRAALTTLFNKVRKNLTGDPYLITGS